MSDEAPVVYGGFWIRFLAFLIDSTAATIAIAPLVTTLAGELLLTNYNLGDPDEVSQMLSDLSVRLALDVLFMGTIFILFWVFKSATPGKMLFKLTIVDAKTFGKASVGQHVVRYFAYFLSTIPLFLGFLWIAFDANKQGWHDKLSGTVVIKGPPREQ